MTKETAKKTVKNEKKVQSKPETKKQPRQTNLGDFCKMQQIGGNEKQNDAKNVRVSIFLTQELYGQYQREAREHAMPVASMMAYALKEYAAVNFPDVESIDFDEAKAARLHAALLDMFPDLAKAGK